MLQLSHQDTLHELGSRPIQIEQNRSVKIRVFLSGTILDVFVDDKYSMTARVHTYLKGNTAFEFRDGLGTISKIKITNLESS